MSWMIVMADLLLAGIGLMVFWMLRRKDNTDGWSLLIYPAYWGGSAALGHLIVMVGLGSLLNMQDGADGSLAGTLYYFTCACWGGLMVYIWERLNR